ncbi:hypothetical protein GGR58DRAFT_459495 [Xylaria digitata]|nr:hypothetical protein GGR58DRAFT_459495 [Xylaria digitata]
MAEKTGTSYSTDPALYIYTSLTAGSSHIVTATSRLETILRANRVPFKALDIATDEKARMIWGRRAGKDESGRARKLPGLVQMGLVLGDLVEIEEWNEYGELKQHVTIYYDDFTIPPKSQAPPPVAMRPLNQPFPTSGIAPSTSSTTKAATTASPPAPAPPAPPLPTDKDKTKIPLSSPTSAGPTKKTANAAASATKPISSIAEEAAKKAKQAQLDRLREKVHGKKDASPSATTESKGKENAKPSTASPTPASTAPKKETTAADSVKDGISNLSIESKSSTSATGLQSPTTGKWHSGASPDGGTQPTLQSPTSGTWKAAAADSIGGVVAGSAVAGASKAVPEESSSEEEDSDEEEDEDEDEEDDDEDEDEEEEEDDEDDEEDSEEDDSEEESEDEVDKTKTKK